MKNYFCYSGFGLRAALVAVGTLLLAACAPGQDSPTPAANIDVSRYVAVGDTYTAGVSAGGLTRASQRYSFPNLLAQQLNRANETATFNQPLLEEGPGTGYLTLLDLPASGIPRMRRVPGQAVQRAINPNTCGGPDTVRQFIRSATAAALPQNLGLPGLQLSQIESAGLGNITNATATGTFNSYFERLLPANDNRTYLQAVTTASASATFFTYFLGLDSMMPFLRSGGECGLALSNTAVNQFVGVLNLNARKALDVLTANGRPGIIAGLPALTNLPLLRQGRGLALQSRLQATFGDTAQLYIQDPLLFGPPQVISNDDYVLAPVLARLGQPTAVVVNGTTMMLPYGRNIRNPVRDADVLDKRELSFVTTALNNHNRELERLAKDVYKLPTIGTGATQNTLDTNNAFPNFVGESISVSGVTYSSELVRGNFFSLDYYTLTPRGNALLANSFIAAINRGYRANIPFIDVNSLPTTAQ